MKQILLLAASVLVVLGAAEVALRFVPPTSLGFEYRDGRFEVPAEFEFELATQSRNSGGFHDIEHGPVQPGTTRVLLLGDSYVAARSVGISQTVGRRLEAHANGQGQGAFEVVSVGQPGWGQKHELAWLERNGKALAPDLVITLFVPLNDVRNNSPELTRVFQEQVQSLVSIRPEVGRMPADEAPVLFLPASRLNQLLSHRIALRQRTSAPDAIPIDYFVFAESPDPSWVAAWSETERFLLATRDTARSLGARYGLASASTPQGVLGRERGLEILLGAYPAMRAQAWDLDRAEARVAAFSAANQIPFLSLETALREEAAAGRTLHWRFDQHWNVLGNDLAGQHLARFAQQLSGD